MARLCGTSNAAPTPWNERAPIRMPTVGANAQASDEAAKIVRPIKSTAPPAEPVSRGATDQNETTEEKCIGIRYPLQRCEVGSQVGLKCGQGDRDDTAIDEGHR